MTVQLSRGKDKPWRLKTPPSPSAYTMYTEEKNGKKLLVCNVGTGVLLSHIEIAHTGQQWPGESSAKVASRT